MTLSRHPRRSAAQWQGLVSQQAASGLTASAFCDRHDLSYASFIQWRSRLRQGEPTVAAELSVASEASPSETTSFIELTAPGDLSGGAERWLIELDLGDSVQLRIAQRR